MFDGVAARGEGIGPVRSGRRDGDARLAHRNPADSVHSRDSGTGPLRGGFGHDLGEFGLEHLLVRRIINRFHRSVAVTPTHRADEHCRPTQFRTGHCGEQFVDVDGVRGYEPHALPAGQGRQQGQLVTLAKRCFD